MADYTKETIGIIGGCGVAAANELMVRIEHKLLSLGCHDDPQQPEIILFQASQAPNRIAFASRRSKLSFVPRYIEIAKQLKACGATIGCIACNTAHCAIEEIENGSGLPFINLIKETLLTVTSSYPKAHKIGILGSSGTKISKTHQKYARELNINCEILFPNEHLQHIVDNGIAAVKSSQSFRSEEGAKQYFFDAADTLISNGAEVLVLGCTEIPLAITQKCYRNIPIVDTLDVLADACIERCAK